MALLKENITRKKTEGGVEKEEIIDTKALEKQRKGQRKMTMKIYINKPTCIIVHSVND